MILPAMQPVGERVADVVGRPVLAKKGEAVTRESGEQIATVAADVHYGDAIGSDAFTAWTIEPPVEGQLIPFDPIGKRWVRMHRGGVDVHLARGWAMETQP